MKLFNRKNRLQRLLEMAEEMLDVPSTSKLGLPLGASDNALKLRLPGAKGLHQETALKAGVIAGGLAGLTIGSAGISALRRRAERTTLNS